MTDSLELLYGEEVSRLTTGNVALDTLLGGGLKPGLFFLLYGDRESGVYFFVHKLLVKCVQPSETGGWGAEALYLNCGNYREDKTILDLELLGSLMKASGIDPFKGMEKIHVFSALTDTHD